MNLCVCAHDLDDHYEGACQVAECKCASYRPQVSGRYSFKYMGVEVRCDTPEDVLALLSFREERTTDADLSQYGDVLRQLYDTLPKCIGVGPDHHCNHPATKAFRRGEGRWCDLHAPEGCPDYPRAEALRRATKILGPAGPKESFGPIGHGGIHE